MSELEQVGVDYVLAIMTAAGPPEVLTDIGGQKDTTVDWDFDTIDVSNKTHGKVKLPGGGGFTLSLDGIIMDSNAGADALEAIFFARTLVKVRMKVGATVKYAGEGYLVKHSAKLPYEGGAEYSYSLERRGQMQPPTP